ncbi:MAG: type II toxin-antitoxin system Phd/YefM family antitoxin [Acidobacteriota bacterium]|nr:type II toxin-antitoxin system Phd/YefM family antitoxin [Acidobacteriota bacterium]MDH3523117.1 type II toxin-antitoxin system Phd/YefM family antitoxin [Acidobacteriota bacterium]
MRQVTATELARNLREVLDRVEFQREEHLVWRNQHQIARIVPGPAHQTAEEAMGDLYRVLSEDAGADWVRDSRDREGLRLDELRNPWDS